MPFIFIFIRGDQPLPTGCTSRRTYSAHIIGTVIMAPTVSLHAIPFSIARWPKQIMDAASSILAEGQHDSATSAEQLVPLGKRDLTEDTPRVRHR